MWFDPLLNHLVGSGGSLVVGGRDYFFTIKSWICWSYGFFYPIFWSTMIHHLGKLLDVHDTFMTPRKFNKRSKRKQTFQHQKGDLRITNEISPGNWTWEWLKIHGNHLVYLGHFYIVRKNPRSRCSRVCCIIHIFHVKTISKSLKVVNFFQNPPGKFTLS